MLHGVPARFPSLRFAFLEGGVAWGLGLYAGLLGVWGKRGGEAIGHLDPAALDRDLLIDLVSRHGSSAFVDRLDRLDEGWHFLHDPDDPGGARDEYADSGLRGPADIEELFTRRFFFGCEADDPLAALAFDQRVSPRGAVLRPVFASDIGHWDVPDVVDVLPEAWEQRERGLLDETQFRAFTCDNLLSLLTGTNPSFFAGTVVEGAAARVVADEATTT